MSEIKRCWGAALSAMVVLVACAPGPEAGGAEGPGATAPVPVGQEAELVAGLEAQLAARDLELAQLREQASPPADQQSLLERVAALELELAREQEARLDRELEWLRYTQAITALELESMPEELEFVPQVPAASLPLAELAEEDALATEPAQPTAEELAVEGRVARALEIQRALVALLTIEEVHALSLLDAGQLGDGWIGPVLFRINGAGGRLAGSLYAERLHLEGSRAGRTLTLVLEDGYEVRSGVQTPFMQPVPLQPSVRRIVLPYLDPSPWAESLPELFVNQTFDEVHDDGTWNLTLVRGTLNLALREDSAGGWYRLRFLGGVTGDVLRDVHLMELDGEGNTRRHLFADRLKISIQERGVLVTLEDGASMRGPEKTPFVGGKLLLYFPRADHDLWIVEGLPLFEGRPVGVAAELPAAGADAGLSDG